ncbi:hypothetical protein ADUPG1_002543, partial [Aduncisulcus paluster]
MIIQHYIYRKPGKHSDGIASEIPKGKTKVGKGKSGGVGDGEQKDLLVDRDHS